MSKRIYQIVYGSELDVVRAATLETLEQSVEMILGSSKKKVSLDWPFLVRVYFPKPLRKEHVVSNSAPKYVSFGGEPHYVHLIYPQAVQEEHDNRTKAGDHVQGPT